MIHAKQPTRTDRANSRYSTIRHRRSTHGSPTSNLCRDHWSHCGSSSAQSAACHPSLPCHAISSASSRCITAIYPFIPCHRRYASQYATSVAIPLACSVRSVFDACWPVPALKLNQFRAKKVPNQGVPNQLQPPLPAKVGAYVGMDVEAAGTMGAHARTHVDEWTRVHTGPL
jgi:hypothetical protein